jgi:hypothetical protein
MGSLMLRRVSAWLLAGLFALSAAAAGPAAPALGDPSPSGLARGFEADRGRWLSLERMLQGYSAEGANVTTWREHGQLRKIELTALGERGRMLAEFYWRAGRLVSARERRIDYGRHIMEIPADQPTPMSVVQDDVIDYAGGLPRLWWRDGNPGQPRSNEARGRARELARLADSLRRLGTLPPPAKGCEWQCGADWDTGRCARFVCR